MQIPKEWDQVSKRSESAYHRSMSQRLKIFLSHNPIKFCKNVKFFENIKLVIYLIVAKITVVLHLGEGNFMLRKILVSTKNFFNDDLNPSTAYADVSSFLVSRMSFGSE